MGTANREHGLHAWVNSPATVEQSEFASADSFEQWHGCDHLERNNEQHEH